MKQEYRPIKRSRQLATLSREHHEGLLFVWKIRQGIILGIPAKEIAKYCAWFWENTLKDHFKREETALSPLLHASDVLINMMKEDHQAITEKMDQVVDDASYDSLQRLAQIIYYHIRFEERSFFKYIEQVVPAEKLDEVVKLLPSSPVPGKLWSDEFWIKKSKGKSG